MVLKLYLVDMVTSLVEENPLVVFPLQEALEGP